MGATINITDANFRRNVQRLYSKGPRVVGELLSEIGAECSIQTIIETKLSRYAEIDDTRRCPSLVVIASRQHRCIG